jgi:hypothetical protein
LAADPVVLNRLRAGLHRFLTALDSEGVALFQAVVYTHIAAGGAYGLLVVGGTPQAVQDSMGPWFNTLWLWLCSGAAVCLLGKMLRGESLYAGMWLQLAGDIAICGVLWIYVVCTFATSWWGRALFAVFIVTSIAECVALLVCRDIRRLVQVEQQYRRT